MPLSRTFAFLTLAVLTFPVAGAPAKKVLRPEALAGAVLWQDPGNITSRDLYYGSGGENTRKASALIRKDIEQMRTVEVSAGELHQAKAYLLRQIPLSASSEEEVAEDLLDRAEMGLRLDEPNREIGKYLIVSTGEIRAAFTKQIRPDDFVQVVRGPSTR